MSHRYESPRGDLRDEIRDEEIKYKTRHEMTSVNEVQK